MPNACFAGDMHRTLRDHLLSALYTAAGMTVGMAAIIFSEIRDRREQHSRLDDVLRPLRSQDKEPTANSPGHPGAAGLAAGPAAE